MRRPAQVLPARSRQLICVVTRDETAKVHSLSISRGANWTEPRTAEAHIPPLDAHSPALQDLHRPMPLDASTSAAPATGIDQQALAAALLAAMRNTNTNTNNDTAPPPQG